MPSASELQRLLARSDFLWHQRFELAPGLHSRGANDVDWLLYTAGLPADMSGASVLDIGTTNGGAAFTLERRGASRILATDIVDPSHFGFEAISAALGSRVEFRQVSVYELSAAIEEQFDYVIFWGVLYHLRHPLLALDNVRALARDTVYVETAVCDHEVAAEDPVARFYRRDELGQDPSNWFAPNVSALSQWCASCGLEPVRVQSWPPDAPSRAMVTATVSPGEPEYRTISYERPLTVSVPGIAPRG